MEHEHRRAFALVHVVHAQPVLLDVVRGVVVAGQSLEALVGRAVEVHATIMTTREVAVDVPNVWSDRWEHESDEEWAAGKSTRLARGDEVGATVYEIAPGRTSGYYHFHHGAEELLVVLRGRPTLREPSGERELAEGDVVLFAIGPAAPTSC